MGQEPEVVPDVELIELNGQWNPVLEQIRESVDKNQSAAHLVASEAQESGARQCSSLHSRQVNFEDSVGIEQGTQPMLVQPVSVGAGAAGPEPRQPVLGGEAHMDQARMDQTWCSVIRSDSDEPPVPDERSI